MITTPISWPDVPTYTQAVGFAEVSDFSELVQFWHAQRAEHADLRPLLVLDDPEQAFYTAFDGIDSVGIGEADDPAAVIAALKQQVEPHVGTDAYASLAGDVLPVDEAEVRLVEANQMKLSMLVGAQSLCLLVPVTAQRDAFYGAPQYDDGPEAFAQVLSIIDRFGADFGYELLGLDSTYIYMVREEPLSVEQAATVANAVGVLHGEFDDEVAGRLAASIANENVLILSFRNW